MIVKRCLICDKEFNVKNNVNANKFCSYSCYWKWLKGKTTWMKGKHHSLQSKEKLKLANTGKQMAEETKRKISLSCIGKNLGKNSGNWRGGSSFLPYSVDWTQTLKKSIRERDRYTCQICFSQPEKLDVHHKDYDKLNCNPDNLISLCHSCHSKTNNNRKFWMDYFNML